MGKVAIDRNYALITIATNRYTAYWQQLVTSIVEENRQSARMRIILFSDQCEEMRIWARSLCTNLQFQFIPIPNLKWPQATLDRYKIIVENLVSLEEDVYIYIDADMVAKCDLILELDQLKISEGMHFVEHPGYCRPCKPIIGNNVFPYTKRKISRHFQKFRGAWENDHLSTAFVPKQDRRVYLHGAFWLGRRESFLEFARICSESTDSDSNRGVIARWHDESHLNKFFTIHGGMILNQRFSWHMKYSKVLPDNPILESREDFGKSR